MCTRLLCVLLGAAVVILVAEPEVSASMSHGTASWTVTSSDSDSSSTGLGFLGANFINHNHKAGIAGGLGALLQKNHVRGPEDLELLFPSVAGRCGGMSVAKCCEMCARLGYPACWCYPKLCHCHFGGDDGNDK